MERELSCQLQVRLCRILVAPASVCEPVVFSPMRVPGPMAQGFEASKRRNRGRRVTLLRMKKRPQKLAVSLFRGRLFLSNLRFACELPRSDPDSLQSCKRFFDRGRLPSRWNGFCPRPANDEELPDNPRLEPPGMACVPPRELHAYLIVESQEGGEKS